MLIISRNILGNLSKILKKNMFFSKTSTFELNRFETIFSFWKTFISLIASKVSIIILLKLAIKFKFVLDFSLILGLKNLKYKNMTNRNTAIKEIATLKFINNIIT